MHNTSIYFKHHCESDVFDSICSLYSIHGGLGPLTKVTGRSRGQNDPEASPCPHPQSSVLRLHR